MMANEHEHEHEQPAVYDIFINFNEYDVQFDFTGNLLNALRRKRFKTFMEKDEIKIGHKILPYNMKALERSKIAIVVFSKNYAADAFGLDELVKIVEGRQTRNQMVFPIFYDVEPSDVRRQRGKYEDDMYWHQRRLQEDNMYQYEERLQQWKSALYQVANISGWHLKKGDSRCEYEVIENIVEKISHSLHRYSVFLSFREQDTRYSFTSYLYNALDQEGFTVFMKMIGTETSESSNSYHEIIQNSRLVIIVLSENYAYSSSCLDELVTILEFKKTMNNKLLVWPIFYKVEPTDIRHQKNSYGKAMEEHKITFGENKVKEWKSALFEIASLNGQHLKHGYDYEYEFVEKIVEAAIKI